MENLTKSLEVNDATFEQEVLKADIPVLVDFTAEWCGPCRMIGPFVDELASEYAGKVKVTKLNVDINPLVTSKYGVRSLPTLLLFKNGEVADRIIGAVPKKAIAEKFEFHNA